MTADLAFAQRGAEIFVPDAVPIEDALSRTTHLGVGAHPDDLEFFAWPGIAACFSCDDKWFTGITITDGGGSPRSGPYAEWSDERMTRTRGTEQRTAAIIGQYSAIVQLAYPSAVVKDAGDDRPIDDLVRLFSVMHPDVVYMHNPADRHETHVACFLRTLAALRRLPPGRRPKKVYGCEVWRGLDWLVGEDRVALPSGAKPHLQAALAGVFDTQIAGGKRYDLAVPARRLANATFDDSHSVDRESGLTYSVDLSPLVADDGLDPVEFTLRWIARLADDVRSRLERVSG